MLLKIFIMQLWSGDMKHLKFIIVFLLLFLVIAVPFTVSALEQGLETQPLSDEEKSEIITRNKFEKLTSYEELPVVCFDVREDHMLLIGARSGAYEAVIAVYDGYGNFQYGFKTNSAGSFYVMWSGNEIAYYGIRSSLMFKVDTDGKIIDVCRVANTRENTSYTWDVLSSDTRSVGTTTYTRTNDNAISNFFIESGAKITKTDLEGTTIVYDASGSRSNRIVIGLIVVFIFLPFLAFASVLTRRKSRRKNISIS